MIIIVDSESDAGSGRPRRTATNRQPTANGDTRAATSGQPTAHIDARECAGREAHGAQRHAGAETKPDAPNLN